MRRKQELRKLETTLERLKTKATFYEEQMDYYNRYIETCLDNLAGKEAMCVVNKVLVWCGVWCGVVWCGVVWCGVVWCGVVWCGVVWCGVVWCGVVWCGVVWCGVV